MGKIVLGLDRVGWIFGNFGFGLGYEVGFWFGEEFEMGLLGLVWLE